ncbi:MAG: RidA family protein [bacterium]
MMQRHHLQPGNMFSRLRDGQNIYTPIVVVAGADHVHLYLSGGTSTLPGGELAGKGDMRAQPRQVRENVKTALENVGGGLGDVVRTVTYTTDVDEHNRHWDVRFEYFTPPPPTSTLLGVSRFGDPGALVEMEVEAVIEPERLRLPE